MDTYHEGDCVLVESTLLRQGPKTARGTKKGKELKPQAQIGGNEAWIPRHVLLRPQNEGGVNTAPAMSLGQQNVSAESRATCAAPPLDSKAGLVWNTFMLRKQSLSRSTRRHAVDDEDGNEHASEDVNDVAEAPWPFDDEDQASEGRDLECYGISGNKHDTDDNEDDDIQDDDDDNDDDDVVGDDCYDATRAHRSRNDLPPPEKLDDWLKSCPKKHRSRLANGWRSSLGSKALLGNHSGFRHVFKANYSDEQGTQYWQTRVSYKGKKHYVGCFTDRVEAARAADRKAVELGMLAHEINYPEEFDQHVALITRYRRSGLAKYDSTLKSLDPDIEQPTESKCEVSGRSTPTLMVHRDNQGDDLAEFVARPRRSDYQNERNLKRANKTGYVGGG